jgi:hypothetical protein
MRRSVPHSHDKKGRKMNLVWFLLISLWVFGWPTMWLVFFIICEVSEWYYENKQSNGADPHEHLTNKEE